MLTVAIIQARLGSTRLPRKVLADLHGRPLIDHVIERAGAIAGVDYVLVNVPDTNLAEFKAHSAYPLLFVGVADQERDVLGSYAHLARETKVDTIIRITGDCPLLAPDLVTEALAIFRRQRVTTASYLPLCMPYVPVADGWDAEIFSNVILQEAARVAGPSQREHVTTWMREPNNAFIVKVPRTGDFTALKCSVDTALDLVRARMILDWLPDQRDFSHAATWHAWNRAGRP